MTEFSEAKNGKSASFSVPFFQMNKWPDIAHYSFPLSKPKESDQGMF